MIVTRCSANGSRQQIPINEVKIGDVVLDDEGHEVRVTTGFTTVGRLAGGRFRLALGGGMGYGPWYSAAMRGGDPTTFHWPVDPPDNPFGDIRGDAKPGAFNAFYRVEVIRFEPVGAL